MKSADGALQYEIRELRENKEVLCPDCSHFSIDAMRRHFNNGYQAGILKKYKRAVWMNLAGFIAIIWLPVLLFLFANLNPLNAAKPIVSVILLLIFLWFGGSSLYLLAGFLWGMAAVSSVRGKLGRLSDDALLNLAVTCYRRNKNSLNVSMVNAAGVKWNSWQLGPLFHSAPAVAKTGSRDESPVT